jgi:hypothetical protein
VQDKPLNILIISFYFPPYDKVGGRRWAKHYKYLRRDGIPAFVLTGHFKGTSPWDKDIEPWEDHIVRIQHEVKERSYHLTTLPRNILEKIRWKLSLLSWEKKKKTLEGNYNDLSRGSETLYLNKAAEIIRSKQINTVILSVGPFSYSSIIPDLKKQFPHVKFVLDFRDYWEDSLVGLNSIQVNFEKKLQESVLASVDLVLSPNEEMQAYYADQMEQNSWCLPHCYDEDDIRVDEVSKDQTSSELSLIYGGAFYGGIEESIESIKKLIDLLSEAKKVKAEFYVSIKGFEAELSHPAITRHGFMDSQAYFKKVRESDYAILILPPNRVNAMSSKFYELLALRKPILYFGGEGAVSEFLIQHRLGFHVTTKNITEQAGLILSNLQSKTIPGSYRVEDHTFAFHTKALSAQLHQLHQS